MLKLMSRSGRKYFGTRDVEGEIDKILELYDLAMEPLTSMRGEHVHKMEFSEPQLSRVRLTELFSGAEWPPGIEMLHAEAVLDARSIWVSRVKRDRKVLDKLVDMALDQLSDIWTEIFKNPKIKS